MNIAAELEKHAQEELAHALIIAKQIDYLGGMPTVTALPVKTSDKAEDLLRFDLDNENQTIRSYRERLRQCESVGEYAIADRIRMRNDKTSSNASRSSTNDRSDRTAPVAGSVHRGWSFASLVRFSCQCEHICF
jgi:Ferritin-like domain